MSSIAPKVLYVINDLPCPPVQGADLRKLHVGRLLKERGDVRVVSLLGGGHVDPARREATEKEFGPVTLMQLGHQRNGSVFTRLRNRFDLRGLASHPLRVSSGDQKLFHRLQEESDLVWIHTLFTANCMGLWHFRKTFLDIDDLGHAKAGLWAKVETSWLQKLNYVLGFWQLKRQERHILDRFIGAAVCSDVDREFFHNDDRIHVIPNGFEAGNKPADCPRDQKRLGCIGKISYRPTRDGLKWFGREVWPLILARCPQARLRVVGYNEGCEDALDFPNFDALGFVEDAAAEMETWSASIVPLRIGGGTRLKILDGFSKLCPVISTSVGAFGLQVTDQKNILLADTPGEFAAACIRLLEEPCLGAKLAEGGWQLLSMKYTWDQIRPSVERAFDQCLDQSRIAT